MFDSGIQLHCAFTLAFQSSIIDDCDCDDLSCGNASAGLQDKKEMIRGVYSVIDQLSRTHLNTLERLIFHLVR